MLPDGGWTVLQRRTGGQVSFNRNWKEYENGFGDLKRDHWLGLYKIWALTDGKRSTLRVDLWDFQGGSAFAQYQDFSVGDSRTNYKLQVGAYSGNAGDAIRGAYAGIDQNGYGFSTSDRDNDGCSPCIFGDIATNDCSAKNRWRLVVQSLWLSKPAWRLAPQGRQPILGIWPSLAHLERPCALLS
ncbi:hypothetical protein SRHO_G00088550 [Serrasalmus rhombeus]